MNDDNIVAAILATSDHSPEVALNRYKQLQELLADKVEAEMPDVNKRQINQVKAMQRSRS